MLFDLLNKKYKNYSFDVIVIAGQSNAKGYGTGFKELSYEPTDKILALNNNRIVIADENKNWSGTKKSYFGLSFAKEYVNTGLLDKGRYLLLLNMAVGGTGFSDNKWGLKDKLYLNMLSKIDLITKFNKDNKIKCILWHQGEADVLSNMSKDKYYHNLYNLIQGTRNHTGIINLPWIAGDMVPKWKKTQGNSKAIELGTREVIENMKNTSYVETDGLEGNKSPDIIHFNRESNIELGKRYFKEYIRICT